MSGPGGVQRYIYWSERLVSSLLNDQGLRIVEKRQRKISTPNIRSFIPTAEWTSEYSSLTRPELADKVERAVGLHALVDLHWPGQIHYAKGRSTITFGEFVGAQQDLALMYTTQTSSDGKVVGVCLFGSLENYSGYIVAPSSRRTGWTSSAAPSIYRFLAEECRVTPSRWETKEVMAREAVKVASRQGISGDTTELENLRGRDRGYTYGEVLDEGEWLAEIYLDYDLSETFGGAQDGHHRILIGAPLWLRTASIRGITLFEGGLGNQESWE